VLVLVAMGQPDRPAGEVTRAADRVTHVLRSAAG
jgi:hypothetical protein